MRAYGKYLIGEKIANDAETSLGIVLPESSQKNVRYRRAKIVSVPEYIIIGTEQFATNLHVGEEVLFDMAGGYDIREGDKEYKVIHIDSVVAIL